MKNSLLFFVFRKAYILIFLLFIGGFNLFAQTNDSSKHVGLLFYNVENLFDTWDDTLKADEEFLPYGEKHWTINRYNSKINKLYKTIIAAGGWDPPAIIGLCEIENKRVLNDLIYGTPLSKFNYKYKHFESPDSRGIDVALLYNEEVFKPVHAEPIPVYFKESTSYLTRDILYVKGFFVNALDTIHVFVNHWPSRRGGQLESESRRIQAAETLKMKVDRIFLESPGEGVLLMGDFNDDPDNQSLISVLDAKLSMDEPLSGLLYNLDGITDNKSGSYKYRDIWNKFDQIIVSGNLLNSELNIQVDLGTYEIFQPAFLTIEDERNLGIKPFATYSGYKYLGGFSDHFPVKVNLTIPKPGNSSNN